MRNRQSATSRGTPAGTPWWEKSIAISMLRRQLAPQAVDGGYQTDQLEFWRM